MDVITIIKRRLNGLWKRGVVLKVNSADMLQRVQIQHSKTEINDVEHFEPYGLTSNPHPGAEAIIVSRGGWLNHIIALVTPDRRYRLKDLAPGEVAMYDDLGNKVVFKRDKIEVVAVSHIDITAPTCTINATTTINGDVTVNGNVTATGEVQGNGIDLSTHVHGGVSSGGSNTGVPA